MKTESMLKYGIVILILMLLVSSVPSMPLGKNVKMRSVDPRLNYLKINEFSSNGTGNHEWVEITNIGDVQVNFTELHLDDQDGNRVNISSVIKYIPPPDANGGYYILVYMGTGTDDTDYHDNSDDHKVVLYANFGRDVFNDDGDDILLYNGTYGTPTCQYIDYIAYSNGGKNQDLDQPPIGSGLTFITNGVGHYGYIPAPTRDESVSLVPNGDDHDEASDWYITRIITTGRYDYSETPGSKNVNILKVDGEDIAPVNQTQGTEVAVLKFVLSGIGTTPMSVNTIYLGLNGSIGDNELQARLYEDTNNNGIWDTGDQAQITYYATFSGHATSFTTPNIQVPIGAHQTYFVTIKLASDANIAHDYSLYLRDIDMGRGADNIHTDEVFIPQKIVSKYVDISPIDQTSPEIVSLSFERKQPLGVGTHTLTIRFNEKMDTNVLPNVTYGIRGVEYEINGMWINDTTWVGNFEITNQSPSGILKLIVSGARDISWNYIDNYVISLNVDIQKPYVKEVYYSHVPPYPFGIPVNITLIFSEDVKDVSSKLVSSHGEYNVKITKENNKTYHITFKTQDIPQANYKLLVYNATDEAGNQMNDYYISNLTMDFTPPTISYVEYKEGPVEGNRVVLKVYCQDNNGIKSVWAIYQYKGQNIKVIGSPENGGYWEIAIVGESVTPPSTKIMIFAEDNAGNIHSQQEIINVIPWWQAMWWLWVIIALILLVVGYITYDYMKRIQLQRKHRMVVEESEIPVSESVLSKITKGFKKEKKRKKQKPVVKEAPHPRKKVRAPSKVIMSEETMEVESEQPHREKKTTKKKKEKEIPELPLEEEYFEEEEEEDII